MTAITAIGQRCIQATASQRARLGQLIRFGLIGLSGIAVNTGALALVAGVWGHHYVVGAIVATQASTTYNFALTNRFVFTDDGDHRFGVMARYLQFSAVNNSMLLLRVPMIVALTTAGLHYLTSNIVSLVAMFLLRFVVADRIIFQRTPPTPSVPLTTEGFAVDD